MATPAPTSKLRVAGLTCDVHKNVYTENSITILFKTFGKDLLTLTAPTREDILVLLDAMKDQAAAAKTCGDKESVDS